MRPLWLLENMKKKVRTHKQMQCVQTHTAKDSECISNKTITDVGYVPQNVKTSN